MTENTSGFRAAVVVSLAAYREARGDAPRLAAAPGRRLLALRLPTPGDVAHRRRMLEHLAGKGTAGH